VLPASEDSITRTTLGTQGGSPRPERAPRPITVRRPAFDFTRIRSRHWFGGDPFISHLLNALSLTFPEGERFFMDAVRQHEPAVESAALKHEIQRFLGQECLHGRAHEAFNDWLSTTGVDPSGRLSPLGEARTRHHRCSHGKPCRDGQQVLNGLRGRKTRRHVLANEGEADTAVCRFSASRYTREPGGGTRGPTHENISNQELRQVWGTGYRFDGKREGDAPFVR
jgi:hypothetical protein